MGSTNVLILYWVRIVHSANHRNVANDWQYLRKIVKTPVALAYAAMPKNKLQDVVGFFEEEESILEKWKEYRASSLSRRNDNDDRGRFDIDQGKVPRSTRSRMAHTGRTPSPEKNQQNWSDSSPLIYTYSLRCC